MEAQTIALKIGFYLSYYECYPNRIRVVVACILLSCFSFYHRRLKTDTDFESRIIIGKCVFLHVL